MPADTNLSDKQTGSAGLRLARRPCEFLRTRAARSAGGPLVGGKVSMPLSLMTLAVTAAASPLLGWRIRVREPDTWLRRGSSSRGEKP
ncbi:uncharacterized protein STAUR_8146 [Stigmatella aurantiaca DW4/3-1]|uniref:Uncharacterized protein n=1 Tax=Stigmatella aurantiaca (strain DW4/3-1) TaxID=378806 RepID=E3FT91_STIAD|nr:uncharacterized protein STAUR_8146 [Stigmatella aurantiaca DW4/3-1]